MLFRQRDAKNAQWRRFLPRAKDDPWQLKSYTVNAAYAAFEEGLKGTLTPGKLADIVVLSRDILTVPDDQIPGTNVMYTIVGGKVAFERR